MICKKEYKNGDVIKPDFKKRYWYGEISAYYPCGFLDDIDATCDTLKELQSLKSKEKILFGWEVFWDSEERKELKND